jgi:hypothetical protein
VLAFLTIYLKEWLLPAALIYRGHLLSPLFYYARERKKEKRDGRGRAP